MLQFYGPMNFWRRVRHRFDYPRPLGELSDRAYADLLLQFQEREGSTDNTTQSPFRRALIEAYNSKDPEDEEGLWCPVMQTFSCDPDQRRGAHIFRKKYGQKVMNQIYGLQSDEELSGVRKLLIMSDWVFNNFYQFRVVIVPAEPWPEPVDDWVLRVAHQ